MAIFEVKAKGFGEDVINPGGSNFVNVSFDSLKAGIDCFQAWVKEPGCSGATLVKIEEETIEIVATYTNPNPNPTTPEVELSMNDLRAGNNYRDSLVQKADAHKDGAPLWHGWAIMNAFLAGAKYARKKDKPS